MQTYTDTYYVVAHAPLLGIHLALIAAVATLGWLVRRRRPSARGPGVVLALALTGAALGLAGVGTVVAVPLERMPGGLEGYAWASRVAILGEAVLVLSVAAMFVIFAVSFLAARRP